MVGMGRPGEKRNRTYDLWYGMIRRCEKPTSIEYHRYGGKGIYVCERWHKFSNFFDDMGNPPTSKHTIDRIDNSNGYEPGNCRWSTMIGQANNRTNNHHIVFNGQDHTLTEWSRLQGIKWQTMQNRIRRGWPIEVALTKKARYRRARDTQGGDSRSCTQDQSP